MAIHKWRRRPTKHFGEVWVPFAQIELQAADGKFHALALQLDSGAVVSLLRRSTADLLGIDLDAGRRIEVSSVGGGTTVAHVHEITTRFDRNIQYRVPFAIAGTEEIPNLLGRLKVFDFLQIDFDGTVEETRIASPWMSEGHRRIWDALIDAERHLVDRYADWDLSPDVRDALRGFVNRGGQLVASVAGLAKLARTYPGPLFIRSLFELSLQVEYLLQDPDVRAKRYKDFQHVTKHKLAAAITANPTGPIGRGLAQSPLRPDGEERVQVEFDRVRAEFVRPNTKRKQRLVSNWYGMRIDELARQMGRDGEYRTIYAICASWSHGDPLSVLPTADHPLTDTDTVLIACFNFYARMLLRIADVGKVILTPQQYELLKGLGIDLG